VPLLALVQPGMTKLSELRRFQPVQHEEGALDPKEVAPDAVPTASGFNIAAFNLGISGTSFVGSRLVADPGILATPWAAMLSVLVAFAIVEWWLAKHQQRPAIREQPI
jgi:hypothetical protein